MKQLSFLLIFLLMMKSSESQLTVFEKSDGKESATYFEVISFYQHLAQQHPSKIKMLTKGITDAGYPLHVVLLDNKGVFDPLKWHTANRVVIMINNGIHPGEPDGIDASMMLARDIVNGKINLPPNVVLALIPVYNIGGSLNRFQLTRISQNGPAAYGFRGNAQNLDLNRDFTKCDSKNARSFASIFHWLNPDLLIDTHVSDGADYQYTISLLSTQYEKLGLPLGVWLRDEFEPGIYEKMKSHNWDLTPYVNVFGNDPSEGFTMFYDPPRFSSGYAALFNTPAYMPETHMLKPYKQRVSATYDLLHSMMQQASEKAMALIQKRKEAITATKNKKIFPLNWKVDSSKNTALNFKGYAASTKPSGLSGEPVLFYDHKKPFTKETVYYNYYKAFDTVTKPRAYIIPQGWWAVTDLLRLNHVKMERVKSDTEIVVTAYHIQSFHSMPRAYEKHHVNFNVKTIVRTEKVHFLKGDYIIYTGQDADRFLVEMLEPTGADSYFAWNFFDAILQQKEYFSDYRWNDIAVDFLDQHPQLKNEFNERLKNDSAFAKNIHAQLDFVYRHSPYLEAAYNRYPVFRLE